MYPTLFRIGTFEITSFGVMVALGALVGLWIYGREVRRSGLSEAANDAAMAGVFGGLVGAKLLWVLEHLGEEPFTGLLFSRGGMSWFGGFIGGVGTAVFMMWRHRVPIVAAVAASTPGLAIGHAIGRVGCFLVGDDYGGPSSLPWAVAFPKGLPPVDVPVHPTQLYEALALVVIATLLFRWRAAGVRDTQVLGRYLVLAGLVRFGIEFIRVNERLVGPLTLAHMIALALVLAGVVVLMRPAAEAVPAARGRGRSIK